MNQESGTLEFFGPLLHEPSKIKREAVRRRKPFDERAIAAHEIPEFEADGHFDPIAATDALHASEIRTAKCSILHGLIDARVVTDS